MKTVEEYMKLPYKLEIIPDTDEPGFIASYPELPGCITCAENISQAVLNAEDAKREWLCTALENGTEITPKYRSLFPTIQNALPMKIPHFFPKPSS